MKSVIFDLDGTLINSLYDIALCMNEVLEKHNYKTHEIEDYNYFLGDGALVLTKNSLPKDSTQEEIDMVLKAFIDVYESQVHNNTKPYNGILSLLEELEKKEIKKSVLSNKPHYFTLKYVNNLFSQFTFQEIHGQKENIPKKPDPYMAIKISKLVNISSSNTVFVGDTPTDINTARAAGMKSVGVAWGFRPIDELKEAGADFIANEPLDIIKFIESL